MSLHRSFFIQGGVLSAPPMVFYDEIRMDKEE